METHGRPPRLKGWDYRRSGAYFVTLVVRDRVLCLRVGGQVAGSLSVEGEAVRRAWERLASHFDRVRLDECSIMHDHVHGVIWLQDHPVYRSSLGQIVRAWKASSTMAIREVRPTFQWQTGFYDRIIRDQAALAAVRRYVRFNHLRHGGETV
jgi:REP-associated tyrosine transposase